METLGKNVVNFLIWAVLFLSFMLLGKIYLDSRSMFLDELNLVRNIIELDFFSLFDKLNYEQFAPPLFLVIVKTVTSVFGATDYMFRLFPFILGFASLLLFFKIGDRYLKSLPLLLAIILFGFSTEFVTHATECKQYIGDLFATLLLLYLVMIRKWSAETHFLLFTVMGAIISWFSMPAVFILFGIGLYLFYINYENRTKQTKLMIMLGIWVLSFSILYLMFLKTAIGDSGLIGFHEIYFFGRNGNTGQQLLGLFSPFIDTTAIPLLGGLILFLLGLYHLYTEDRKLFILLLSPILIMLLASFLEQYSLINRLLLFSLPLWLYIISYGVQFIIQLPTNLKVLKSLGYILTFLMVLGTLLNSSSLEYLNKKLTREEGKWILLELQKQEESTFFFTHHAIPSYEYYVNLKDDPIHINGKVIKGDWDSDLLSLKKEWMAQGIEKIWIVDIHTFGNEKEILESQVIKLGRVGRTLKADEATARLIYLK